MATTANINNFWPFRGIKGNFKATLADTSEITLVPGYMHKDGVGILTNLYALIIANTNNAALAVDIRNGRGNNPNCMTIAVPANETRTVYISKDDSIELAKGNIEWTGQLRGSGSSLEITSLFVRN